MTAKELIEILNTMDDDTDVLFEQQDESGGYPYYVTTLALKMALKVEHISRKDNIS